jgi:hypothetical protein
MTTRILVDEFSNVSNSVVVVELSHQPAPVSQSDLELSNWLARVYSQFHWLRFAVLESVLL